LKFSAFEKTRLIISSEAAIMVNHKAKEFMHRQSTGIDGCAIFDKIGGLL